MAARLGRIAVAMLWVLAFACVVLARRPDAVTVPQFWAEDGMEWWARAYNHASLDNLVLSYGGYFQTFPRLVAAVSVPFGLGSGPLLMTSCALLVQALAAAFLMSSRFDGLLPGGCRRLGLALLLLVVPNTYEVHLNVTNSHIHLATLAFLVLLAQPSPSRAWRAFDVGVLVLSGLSGPFCLMLLPVAVLVWLRDRQSWNGVRMLVVLLTVVVQTVKLSSGKSGGRVRWVNQLGASPENLLDILGGQVFVGGIGGMQTYGDIHAAGWGGLPWLPAAIAVLGLLFVARVALETRSFALRVFLLFAALHFAAALRSPIIMGPAPAWELLRWPGAGMRYYYFVILAFVATLLWSVVADRNRVLRGVAAALLTVLLLVGIPRDFALPRQPDLDFPQQVARFEAASPRERVVLYITPEPWTMQLVKRHGR